MCGIAGIVRRKGEAVNDSLLLSMAEILSHRGPDDEKFIILDSRKKEGNTFTRNQRNEHKGNIGFAHRRLSIIDLSELGSQPMADEEKTVWIICNGEVFNYLELREELQKRGKSFYSRSDTEVIIQAYKEWGKECLAKFNGMWALVIYDLRRNVIFGARDRFGIKPFYYHISPESFSFASEIKALLNLPWISKEAFLPTIKDYLFYSRTGTSKYTFFKNIYELEAGHFFEIDLNNGLSFRLQRWWDLTKNLPTPPEKQEEQIESFRDLLFSSIKLRLRSDVPIGTCLSGGLDSSAVVSLAKPLLQPGNQKTFSMVNPGFDRDESSYVDLITKKYNLPSYKVSLKGRDLLNDMEVLMDTHDEPFASTSVYGQWKVFQLAKQNGVKVTLDGQGGDELLAGYPYFKNVYWSELLQKVRLLKYIQEISSNPQPLRETILNFFISFSGFFFHRTMISLAGIKNSQYRTNWIHKKLFHPIPPVHQSMKKAFPSKLNQRLYEVHRHDGLPALLRYADRNSMAHGLEARMPFLDYRLVSYVFALSPELKIHRGLSKYILRRALKKDVPKSILTRRDKIGFETPEAKWFREELSPWIKNIINSKSMEKRGFYRIPYLRAFFEKHNNGRINASRIIWRSVNLELWMRRYFD
jgi:asparagine synthase (glutamine-hydrolysing)